MNFGPTSCIAIMIATFDKTLARAHREGTDDCYFWSSGVHWHLGASHCHAFMTLRSTATSPDKSSRCNVTLNIYVGKYCRLSHYRPQSGHADVNTCRRVEKAEIRLVSRSEMETFMVELAECRRKARHGILKDHRAPCPPESCVERRSSGSRFESVSCCRAALLGLPN